MTKEGIINKTVLYVKKELCDEGSGHDWWHIFRVWNTAKKLANKEGANMFIVELAALLHDIADRKLNYGNEKIGMQKLKIFVIVYYLKMVRLLKV